MALKLTNRSACTKLREIIKLRSEVSKAEPVIGWKFRAFLLNSSRSKQNSNLSLQRAARNINYFAVWKQKESDIQLRISYYRKAKVRRRSKRFLFVLTVCFCRGVIVRALTTQSCCWKSFERNFVEFASFYLFCRRREPEKTIHKHTISSSFLSSTDL